MVGDSAGLTAIRSGWRCNRYRIEVEFDELWHAAHPHSDMTNRANPITEVFPDKRGPSSATTPMGGPAGDALLSVYFLPR
jgi:hypothetical protein